MGPSWREVVRLLTDAAPHGCAVTGSCALALHGMDVEPSDVDIVATEEGVAKIAKTFAAAVTADDNPYARENIRADRRVALEINGIEVEVLTNLRNVVGHAETMPFDLARVVLVAGVAVLPLHELVTIYARMGHASRAGAIENFIAR